MKIPMFTYKKINRGIHALNILSNVHDIFSFKLCMLYRSIWREMDYRFHAAHLDRGLTIHEAVPGGFNRAGEGL